MEFWEETVELGHKQVFLTVPTFVIGYPTFDRGLAAKYIVRQLTLGGFDVNLVNDYNMYVSWNIRKKTKQKTEPDIYYRTKINGRCF